MGSGAIPLGARRAGLGPVCRCCGALAREELGPAPCASLLRAHAHALRREARRRGRGHVHISANVCYFRRLVEGSSRRTFGGPWCTLATTRSRLRVQAWGAPRHRRSASRVRHPSRFTGDYYAGRDRDREAGSARHPRARLFRTRGLAGRRDARARPRASLATARPRPGLAARHRGRVLDDEVRAVICPDKVTTSSGSRSTTPRTGRLRSNVTIMFGHSSGRAPGRHLLRAREQQRLGRLANSSRSPSSRWRADLPGGPGPAGSDVRRGAPDPRGRASRAPPRPPTSRRAGSSSARTASARRSLGRQRPRRDADERVDLPCGGSEWGQEIPPEAMEALIRSAVRSAPADDDVRDAAQGRLAVVRAPPLSEPQNPRRGGSEAARRTPPPGCARAASPRRPTGSGRAPTTTIGTHRRRSPTTRRPRDGGWARARPPAERGGVPHPRVASATRASAPSPRASSAHEPHRARRGALCGSVPVLLGGAVQTFA